MADKTNSSQNLFLDSSIVNSDSKKIDEASETAIRNNKGNVIMGGEIVPKTEKKTSDVYGKFFETVDSLVSSQVPKVGIVDNKISISAPQTFFDSPVSGQLEEELSVLRGADLKNPEIVNAIDKLNEEIRNNYSEAIIEQSTGWTPEEYNDYNYALQTVSGSNPMKSTNKLKWAKDGEIVMGDDGKPLEQTPKEWVDYWKKTMNTQERENYFLESLKSRNPYERTMALVLGQGGSDAVYGFSPLEQAGKGVASIWNQIKKLPEGSFKLLAADNHTKRVESLSKKLNVSSDALSDMSITNESQFEDMKKTIEGKTWSELTEKQKAFVLELGVSKESIGLNDSQRDLTEAMQYHNDVGPIKGLSSDDKEVSKKSIQRILENSSFEKYKGVRDNYDTWLGYNKEANRLEEELEKSAFWSRSSQNLGNIAGTIARYLWENAIVQGLTGGISGSSLSNSALTSGVETGGVSMNAISDKIVDTLSKHGYSLGSTGAQELLNFTANLIGTIPEDILQTFVDNVLTYNADENANLLNPSEMGENFRNNLIFMSLFNMAKTGINSVKRYRIAKQLAKQADLNSPIDIEGLASDADDLARAAKDGLEIRTENEKVSIIDGDGNERILENVTPEQAEMAQTSLFSQQSMVKENSFDVFDKSPSTVEQKLMIDESSVDAPNGYESTADYYRRAKNQTVDFVYMTPDEYLEALLEKNGGPYQDIEAIYQRSSERTPKHTGWRDYLDDMRSGNFNTEAGEGKFPPPYLIYDADGLDSQEGIHRVLAAKELGVEKIPVSVQHPYNESPEIVGKILEGKTKVETDIDTVSASGTPKLDDTDLTGIDADDIAKASGEDSSKITVEVDSPDGAVRTEVPNYRPRNFDEAIKLKVEPTPASVDYAQKVQLETVMKELPTHLSEFHDKFGDVTVSDFDWVWYNTKKGLSPEQIVGTTDPTTNRVITQNKIDAMKWWGDQPFTKELRLASRGALGLNDDFNVLGYLPHTTYDPSNISLEEALTGTLWETSSGASVLGDDGEYKGFGGTFEDRYKTFASNMLWDSKADAVATAKLIEEAQMNGRELTPELVEQSRRAVEGRRKIQSDVDNASCSKELNEALASDSGYDKEKFDKIDKAIDEQAPEIGLGQAIHDNLYEIYPGADSHNVVNQLSESGAKLDTLSDSMRKIQLENAGNMYDAGGADVIYAPQNAIEFTNRWIMNGGGYDDLREMGIEYEIKHSGRPRKYAEKIVDKWIARLANEPGPITKAKMIRVFGNAMRWEAQTRLNRWLALANYEQFNPQTKKFINNYLVRHMQMNSVKNNRTISQKLTKYLTKITEARYRALFYINIKNALLQLSEMSRMVVTFKWGDLATMLRRLAIDDNFRTRVDIINESVSPMTDRLKAELYGDYANVADNMEVTKDGVTFKSLGKKALSIADRIGLSAINTAENIKNKVMVAGLLQEADSRGLTGDEALRYVRSRFERVALAQNEMGQIGLAASPIAKPMLFLQNYQIRELGMHYYNIKDLTGMEKSVPKWIPNWFKYASKVVGTKIATALVLTRLGYSAQQALGIDPFGLLDNYDSLDDEDMEWQDYIFKTPLFAGGLTSLISDLYFMARKAYEDSHQQTISEEVAQRSEPSWGLDFSSSGGIFDYLMNGAENFIPGSTFAKRLSQMNEMMDSGWAVSSTGNKMYTAPNDTLNTILGYLFGRSATANAQQYSQNYGDSLLQTLGRFNPLREYNEFDPIDTKNYTDWFKGDENDLQQFNKGKYWFQNERDKILDKYQSAISKRSATSDEIAEAKNNMNRELEELFNKLERFVTAYEKKNGTITPAMAKQILSILNTEIENAGDNQEQADERRWAELDKALGRYSSLGLSPVGTYTGPSELNPDQEVKYQGSPQYRAAVNGYYDLNDEAVDVLKQADEQLKPIRESIKQRLSDAYAVSDWDTVESIQKSYLNSFDNEVAPIIALYGNSILNSTDVANQLQDMLSTGSNRRTGNLIPSSQYSQNKYGRYQSMPYQEVDVGAWAKQRYSNDTYKNPTVRSDSTAQEDLTEIKKLISQGKSGRARARALELKVRVDNQIRALNESDYEWLNNYINNKETK